MDNKTLKMRLAESEKKQRELELRVEELTDFIENASLPIHWVNGSGIIIWVNKVELELLGYAEEEYVGKHISNFHADKEVIEDIMERLIRKETLRNYPARLKCRNGEIKTVLINSNVFWKEDKFIHTRCFTIDISDLKSIEQKNTELIRNLQMENKILREKLNSHKINIK